MEEKPREFTVSEVLALCQIKLSKVPYTIETDSTVGQPIRDVVMYLEKIKNAIIEVENKEVK